MGIKVNEYAQRLEKKSEVGVSLKCVRTRDLATGNATGECGKKGPFSSRQNLHSVSTSVWWMEERMDGLLDGEKEGKRERDG